MNSEKTSSLLLHVRSDMDVMAEVEAILRAYTIKANELLDRNYTIQFEITNGNDDKPVTLNRLIISKRQVWPKPAV